jgi:hypothetical protein
MADQFLDEGYVLAELYGAHQTFRRLGYPSDNLYLSFRAIAPSGPFKGQKCASVCLRWRDKEFNFTVAPVRDQHAFAERWKRMCKEANAETDKQKLLRFAAMYASSQCFQNRDTLVETLTAKGMAPPGAAN